LEVSQLAAFRDLLTRKRLNDARRHIGHAHKYAADEANLRVVAVDDDNGARCNRGRVTL
jgi:hypothetical protein